MDISIQSRKQVVLNEIRNYSRFDQDCHEKLQSFATIIYKLGHFKQKIALHQWYDKSLRPLKTRQQNDDLALVADCNRLQSKIFYAWRGYQRDKLDSYHLKTNAIERIWHRLIQDSKQEKKRAMDIWKQKLGFNKLTDRKLKQIIKRRNDRFLAQAIYNWKNFSMVLENACRMRMLQVGYTEKLYLSQLFNQMKSVLRFQKQKRIRALNSYVKAWKDACHYNRHLMQSNMAAIQFGKVNTSYSLRSYFNALRQNAETKKFKLLDHAVKKDMNIAIAQTAEFNKNKSIALLTSNQQRAGNIVRDMLAKRLWSYVEHWKNENSNYRITMNTKVRDKIIRLY